MGIKEQFNKLKDNWLIVGLIIVGLLFMIGGDLFGGIGGSGYVMQANSYDRSYEFSDGLSKSSGYYGDESDFAPEVSERKITKTANLGVEAPKGEYFKAEDQLRNIISSSNSFILNENVNRYGEKNKVYYSGNFQIKVDVNKYDSVVSQLKNIGEVQNFRENARDITGSYTNQEIELNAEKARLERYNTLMNEAETVEEKLDLTDRIFDQERRIKYIEESLSNMDQKIDYSTLTVNINEKRSDYYNVELVKFSRLIRNFVDSFSGLFVFVATILPWSIAASIIWLFYRIFKKKKKQKEEFAESDSKK